MMNSWERDEEISSKNVLKILHLREEDVQDQIQSGERWQMIWRQKMRWRNTVKIDLRVVNIREKDAQDRV
jgi:hypothetical protein